MALSVFEVSRSAPCPPGSPPAGIAGWFEGQSGIGLCDVFVPAVRHGLTEPVPTIPPTSQFGLSGALWANVSFTSVVAAADAGVTAAKAIARASAPTSVAPRVTG